MTAQQNPPQATMAYLSQRKSEKGRTYFVGWLGHSKLLLFKTGDLDKFGNPVWRLVVQEGEVKPGTFHKAPASDSAQPETRAKPPPVDNGPPPFDDPIGF